MKTKCLFKCRWYWWNRDLQRVHAVVSSCTENIEIIDTYSSLTFYNLMSTVLTCSKMYCLVVVFREGVCFHWSLILYTYKVASRGYPISRSTFVTYYSMTTSNPILHYRSRGHHTNHLYCFTKQAQTKRSLVWPTASHDVSGEVIVS